MAKGSGLYRSLCAPDYRPFAVRWAPGCSCEASCTYSANWRAASLGSANLP
jgi:hypothetical protein